MQRGVGKAGGAGAGEPGGEHTAAERGKCGLVKPQTFRMPCSGVDCWQEVETGLGTFKPSDAALGSET